MSNEKTEFQVLLEDDTGGRVTYNVLAFDASDAAKIAIKRRGEMFLGTCDFTAEREDTIGYNVLAKYHFINDIYVLDYRYPSIEPYDELAGEQRCWVKQSQVDTWDQEEFDALHEEEYEDEPLWM